MCKKHFAKRHGRDADRVIRQFLAYKVAKGLEKVAVLPDSIPCEAYLGGRESETSTPEEDCFSARERALMSLEGQPYRAASPMQYAHHDGQAIDLADLVNPEPELTTLPKQAFKQAKQTATPVLHQPVPSKFKPKLYVPSRGGGDDDTQSDVTQSTSSVVRRLTAIAGNSELDVPIIDAAPAGRRHHQTERHGRGEQPRQYARCPSDETGSFPTAPSRSAPSLHYFVLPDADPMSPTGGSARVRSRSHERVAVPPPRRLDGVFDPSAQQQRQQFFSERGLPSERHRRNCASTPPSLVSVSVPAEAYSCAAQAACFCAPGRPTCPSCGERKRLSDELRMSWL
ncbi:hypothetical protein GGR56DRAFT_674999 [Xylariaceae sp. FL0804]|nr:hypothetical protein GGR56DRAFT_674999 [Xylariaceae sp. FL0804]